MKKIAVIILMIVLIIGCKKSSNTQKTNNSTTTNTTPPAPASVTALCGAWIMDSLATFRVNFHVTGDTVWSSSIYYSNPAMYYMTLMSSSYTYVGQETITAYEYKGVNPQLQVFNCTMVWKITGDTVYFPTTNKPVQLAGMYYGIEKLTSNSLLLTTRAIESTAGVNMTFFNKYYYHK